MSDFHTVNSISVEDCQQMIMDSDYLMMYKGKRHSIKKARKAFEEFAEKLRGAFGSGENVSGMIEGKVLTNSLSLKKDGIINLKKRMSLLYLIKDTPEKIRLLSRAQADYRDIFHNYPQVVDCKTNEEEGEMSMEEYKEYGELQADQIKQVISPMDNEIRRLEYKIKERLPKEAAIPEESKNENEVVLESHIDFIEQVEPEKGYFDRRMKVSSLVDRYNRALVKYNRLNAKQ